MTASPKDYALAGITAVVAIMLVWLQYAGGWDADLSAIYYAALSYGMGQPDLIYLSQPEFFGSSASLEWEAMARAAGYDGVAVLPYLYAPIWAAVLAPVAVATTPAAFFNAVLLVHAAFCAGSVFLAWRIGGRVSLPVWSLASVAIVLGTSPFFMGFWLNQPQFIVTFLVLLAIERARAGAPLSAGAALGLAAAIKLTPAVFVVLFLMDRNWKAAGVAVVTGLALLGISLAVAGVDLHADYIAQLQRATAFLVLTPINLSLEGVVAGWAFAPEWFAASSEIAQGYDVRPAGGAIALASKVALLGFIGLLWLATNAKGAPQTAVGPLLALWSAMIFFGPLGWSHYLIGPLLLLPAFIGRDVPRGAVVAAVVIVAILSHPVQNLLAEVPVSRAVLMSVGSSTLVALAFLGLWAAFGWKTGPDSG